jgi:hypothetical protein
MIGGPGAGGTAGIKSSYWPTFQLLKSVMSYATISSAFAGAVTLNMKSGKLASG